MTMLNFLFSSNHSDPHEQINRNTDLDNPYDQFNRTCTLKKFRTLQNGTDKSFQIMLLTYRMVYYFRINTILTISSTKTSTSNNSE